MSSRSNLWRACWLLLLGGAVLVLAGIVVLARMVKVQDQDVSVYSVLPDNKVQIIGLRHRTFLLDYGGSSDLVLFSTTLGTGVVTFGHKEDVYGEANRPP
jgi:hypothetical protein